jgi:polysaccharide export outer membrane protein
MTALNFCFVNFSSVGRCAGAFALAIAALSGACAPSDQKIESFIHDWEADVSTADYRVQPPDAIEISSSQAPEIDGEIQVVRQDGKISLRLLDEVQVAGLTPLQISDKLESLLAQYYVDPRVNVRLARGASKKFYVFGQVEREGPFIYTGRDTLLSAIADAKLNHIAARDTIKVIRPSDDPEKRSVLTVNADRMIMNGRLEQNLLLQENDIVYVPPTVLGWIGLRLQEVFYPIGPAVQTLSSPSQASNSLDFSGKE